MRFDLPLFGGSVKAMTKGTERLARFIELKVETAFSFVSSVLVFDADVNPQRAPNRIVGAIKTRDKFFNLFGRSHHFRSFLISATSASKWLMFVFYNV